MRPAACPTHRTSPVPGGGEASFGAERLLRNPRDALDRLGGDLRAGGDAGLHEVLGTGAHEVRLGAGVAAGAAQRAEVALDALAAAAELALEAVAGGRAAALEAAQVGLDAAPLGAQLALDLVERVVLRREGDDVVAGDERGADGDRDGAAGEVDVALDRRALQLAARLGGLLGGRAALAGLGGLVARAGGGGLLGRGGAVGRRSLATGLAAARGGGGGVGHEDRPSGKQLRTNLLAAYQRTCVCTPGCARGHTSNAGSRHRALIDGTTAREERGERPAIRYGAGGVTTRSSVRRIQPAGSSSSAIVGSRSGAVHARLSASIPPRATTASQKRLPCSYWRIFMSRPSRRSSSLNSGGGGLSRSFSPAGRGPPLLRPPPPPAPQHHVPRRPARPPHPQRRRRSGDRA